MRKYLPFLLAAFFFSGIYFSINHFKNTSFTPAPTDGTIVRENVEEGDNQSKREAWFEEMHQAAPGVNWRTIEYQTALQKHKTRAKLRAEGQAKSGQEVLANGNLVGEWYERGSNNQAGNIGVTEYDAEEDRIYLISGGGTLFRGLRDGSYWGVFNEDLRFNDRFLRIINTDSGKRMLACVGNIPHYSDDQGKTWTASTGANTTGGCRDALAVVHEGQNYIYLLGKSGYWEDVHLYASSDNGETFTSIHSWNEHELDRFSMVNPHHTKEIYLYEKVGQSSSKFSQVDVPNLTLTALNNGPFDIGGARANMTATLMPDETIRFFIYDDEDFVYRTDNFGESWENHTKLPASPWGVGIYVSKFDPSIMYMGEVECFRTTTALFWDKINNWGDYYQDVENKLHADIMYFNEFETTDGEQFTLISNHGGLSISYDNAATNKNIGLEKLNVAQYYDVRTNPNNPQLLYAGSQDQGFQRGEANSYDDIADLDQIISGDYGHIAFTNNGNSFWTVYPGGWVSYYANSLVGGITADITIDSDNESVWIPPLVETPDPSNNYVYLAGGNVEGGEGSYIVKMRYWAGSVETEQLPFDFKAESTGEVSAIEISPLNDNIMYASTTSNFFYYSLDAGQTWEQSTILVPGPHYLYGTSIYASTQDENTLYIAGSGYSNASVYKSTNNGMNFEPMNEGLPPTLVFEITANEDESLFFAATEAGPYVYVVAEEQWYDMAGLGAPNQTYWSVEYLPEIETIRFGTYGRGIWDFQLQELVNAKEVIEKDMVLTVYPNPTAEYLTIQIPESLQANVRLEIFNLSGQKILEQEVANQKEFTINVSSLSKANYVLLCTDGKQAYRAKFMVQ